MLYDNIGCFHIININLVMRCLDLGGGGGGGYQAMQNLHSLKLSTAHQFSSIICNIPWMFNAVYMVLL